MIRAIQIDNKGNEIKGTERTFTEKHWAFMEENFGKYLRWKRIADAVKIKNKQKSKDNEEADFYDSDGGVSTAIDG